MDATVPVQRVSPVLIQAAAAWSDPDSDVRRKSREALAGGHWPLQTVEAALDNALFDFESAAVRYAFEAGPRVAGPEALVILPGNIIGPAVTCAFCAAVAGARVVLKSSRGERRLAEIVAAQFDRLGAPLAGTVRGEYWTGGDASREDALFKRVDIIIVFGEDTTVADVERRAPRGALVRGYGNAYSIAYVPAQAHLLQAADAAAHDIAMFDQRGCMSPQTVYVQGDERRSVVFAEELHAALTRVSSRLPRANPDAAERAAASATIRRLRLTALPLGERSALFAGPLQGGAPSHVVVAQSFSKPVCVGFGRIAVVKPCLDAAQAASAASTLDARLETVGIAGDEGRPLRSFFERAGAARVCALGSMQRPSFGYRPKISDFAVAA